MALVISLPAIASILTIKTALIAFGVTSLLLGLGERHSVVDITEDTPINAKLRNAIKDAWDNLGGKTAYLLWDYIDGLINNLIVSATTPQNTAMPRLINGIRTIERTSTANASVFESWKTANKDLIEAFKEIADFKEIYTVAEVINNTLNKYKNAQNFFLDYQVQQMKLLDVESLTNIITAKVLHNGNVLSAGGTIRATADFPYWFVGLTNWIKALSFGQVELKTVSAFGGAVKAITSPTITTTADITQITNNIKATNAIIPTITQALDEKINGYIAVISITTTPPTTILQPPRTETDTDEDTLLLPPRTIDDLAELIGSQTQTFTRTKTRTRTETKRAKQRAKKKARKMKKIYKGQARKKRNKPPAEIHRITKSVGHTSQWIAKIEFKFPNRKPLLSDDRGTLSFILKDYGQVIRFVRVKRGTFSVISQYKSTGNRLWSQFWRHKIVDRTQLAWLIRRIGVQERQVGIRDETRDKLIKYNQR